MSEARLTSGEVDVLVTLRARVASAPAWLAATWVAVFAFPPFMSSPWIGLVFVTASAACLVTAVWRATGLERPADADALTSRSPTAAREAGVAAGVGLIAAYLTLHLAGGAGVLSPVVGAIGIGVTVGPALAFGLLFRWWSGVAARLDDAAATRNFRHLSAAMLVVAVVLAPLCAAALWISEVLFVLWLVVLLFVVIGAALGLRDAESCLKRALRGHVCGPCGYRLDGAAPDGRCPECGEPTPAAGLGRA